MIIKFNKCLYPKEAMIKAAFQFTEKAYLYLSQDDNDFIVEISPKDKIIIDNIEHEFMNEILSQTVHYLVSRETAAIRKIIMGRALSSTMIMQDSEEPVSGEDFDLDSILTDWFDQHDNTI